MQERRVVSITNSVFYLLTNPIYRYINHQDTFDFDNKGCTKGFLGFTDEKRKLKVKLKTGLFIS